MERPTALRDKSQRMVLGEGPLDCEICLLGEALGWEEVRDGRNFVGDAGKTLDGLLGSSNILRSLCYVTNVIKERPPGNDISVFVDVDSKTVSKEGLEYIELLKDELANCKANVFVPFGNVPLLVLTGLTGITHWCGSILEATLDSIKGRKVIPAIHPSAVNRGEFLFKYSISRALSTKVIPQSKFPEIRLPIRRIQIWPVLDEAIAFLEMAAERDIITIDIETVNGIACFGIAISSDCAICIPFISQKGDWYTPEEETEIWLRIAAIMENKRIVKVGQNIVYDAGELLRLYGIHTRNVEDTMVAMGIIYPDLPKKLEFSTAWYTDEPYYKEDRKAWKRIGDYGMFWIYNGTDCCVTHEILPKMMADLEELGNVENYRSQVKLVEPILYMQERGIKADAEGLATESARQELKIEKLQMELNEICGQELNANSHKQLKAYFYIKKGIKAYTKKGSITVDENALKRLARGTSVRAGLKEAKLILEIRRAVKLKSTYLDVTLDQNGRLKSSMNPMGTVSGRFTSSKTLFGIGTNMQTIPHHVRKYLRADDGYIMYSVDLAQAENRIVAYIAPEPSMIEAFENDEDVHVKTAGLLFNKSPEEISDEPGSSKFGDGLKSERFWGKTCNHELDYDMGYKNFSLEYELQEAEGKRLIGAYRACYPGVKKYHNWIQESLRSSRKVTNCFGRTYYFLERWGDDLFRSAYSYIPQSTVGCIINFHGLIPLYYRQDLFKEVEILLQIHDEILFQIRLDTSARRQATIMMMLKKLLEQPTKWRATEFVIPAEFKMGPSWSKEEMKGVKVTESLEETEHNISQALGGLQ